MKKVDSIKSDDYNSFMQTSKTRNKNSFINTGIQLHRCKENLVEQNNMRINDIKTEKTSLLNLEKELKKWAKPAFGRKITNVNIIECLSVEDLDSTSQILSYDKDVDIFKYTTNNLNYIYFIIKNSKTIKDIGLSKDIITKIKNEQITQSINNNRFLINYLDQEMKQIEQQNIEIQNNKPLDVQDFGVMHEIHQEILVGSDFEFNLLAKGLKKEVDSNFELYKKNDFSTSLNQFGQEFQDAMDEGSPSHYLEGDIIYSRSQRNKDLSDVGVCKYSILEEDTGSIDSKKSIDISPVRCNEDFENGEFPLRIKKQAIKQEKEKGEIDLGDLVEYSRDMYEEKPQKLDTKKNNAKAKVKIAPKNTKTSIKKEEITNQLIYDRVGSKNRTINKRIIYNYNYNSNSYTDKTSEIYAMLRYIYELIDRILSISRNNYYYKAKIFSVLHKKY